MGSRSSFFPGGSSDLREKFNPIYVSKAQSAAVWKTRGGIPREPPSQLSVTLTKHRREQPGRVKLYSGSWFQRFESIVTWP